MTWEVASGAPPTASYDAVVTLGGAANSNQDDGWIESERAFLRSAVGRGVPVLAVCLGAQLLAEAIGGSVARMPVSEIGWYPVSVDGGGADDPLLASLAPSFEALEWHHNEFRELPERALVLARSAACVPAYRAGAHAWGIEFHPQVTLPDFERWVEGYRRGEDTGGLELDSEALLARTRARIDDWNALGRGLCDRFLAVVDQAR